MSSVRQGDLSTLALLSVYSGVSELTTVLTACLTCPILCIAPRIPKAKTNRIVLCFLPLFAVYDSKLNVFFPTAGMESPVLTGFLVMISVLGWVQGPDFGIQDPCFCFVFKEKSSHSGLCLLPHCAGKAKRIPKSRCHSA